jgi:hypothetical protein
LQDLDTRLPFPPNRHFSTQLDIRRLQGLEMPCLMMESLSRNSILSFPSSPVLCWRGGNLGSGEV